MASATRWLTSAEALGVVVSAAGCVVVTGGAADAVVSAAGCVVVTAGAADVGAALDAAAVEDAAAGVLEASTGRTLVDTLSARRSGFTLSITATPRSGLTLTTAPPSKGRASAAAASSTMRSFILGGD